MTKNNLIFLSFAFTFIIVICAAKQSTPPKSSPQPTENTSEVAEMSAEPIIEPQEPAPDPIEPIHEEPYIRYKLTEYERTMVERVVTAESENQHLNGQIAVAQCILNTAEATGMRPDAVVLAPNQYASPAQHISDSVKQAVSAVFDEGIEVIDEPIRFFYAPKYSSGSWHEANLEYVCTIGGHKFFKLPGAVK